MQKPNSEDEFEMDENHIQNDHDIDNEEEEEEEEEDDDDNRFLDTTCLVPEEPQTNLVVNTSNKIMKKRLNKEGLLYEIAPGEGKIPTNWLREKDFDITAFPDLFPDGKFGFHYDRKLKLSPINYFSQRILNRNQKFAQDPDYLFIAQQFVERHLLEKQIDLAMRKGILEQTGAPKMVLNSNVYDLFKTIPGSPSYWRNFRNEIFARLEQLGPFHLFFTLSCGEARWPEVFVAILKDKGCEIKYDSENDWDGLEESIMIFDPKRCPKPNGLNLAEYRKKFITNVSEFMKKHFVLVTRVFDERVKNFMHNILLPHKVKHYSYRVEFQQRGMPHIHGILWLKDEIVGHLITDDKQFCINKVDDNGRNMFIDFVDQITTCKLPNDNEELLSKVLAVNCHKCTKTCTKRSEKCRFGFPRFPSKRTLIASPIDPDLPEEVKKYKLQKATMIAKKVKQKLQELDKGMIVFYYSFFYLFS